MNSIFRAVHHIAIICSDYQISKQFYTEVLGFTIVREVYRESRQSYKLDLALHHQYVIELFFFSAAACAYFIAGGPADCVILPFLWLI